MSVNSHPSEPDKAKMPLVQWLTKPADSIQEPNRLRHARLLSALLVSSIFLVIVGIVLNATPTLFVVLLVLAVSYGLSRTRYYFLASILTLAAVVIPSLATVLTLDSYTLTRIEHNVLWLLLPVFLGSILLPLRQALTMTWALHGFVLLLPVLIPEMRFEDIVFSFSFMLVLSTLVVIAATLRKQTEAALAEERALLRTVIDHLPDLIMAKDRDGRFTLANEALARLAGAPAADDMLGKTEFDFVPWDIAAQFQATEQEILRIGKPQEGVEERSVDAEGNEKWLSTTKVPYHDAQGNIVGLVGIGHDITARKQVEEQLRKLSLAVEQSPNSIVITDLDGDIEYVNPTFTSLTGYTYEEVIGQNPRILQFGDAAPGTYEQLWETLTAGEVWRGEFHNRKKDGSPYWELASISPVKDAEGRVTHYLAIKEDITMRKSMENALQDAYDRLAMLVRTDAELIKKLDSDHVQTRTLDAAMRMSRADAGFIGLLDGKDAQITHLLGDFTPDLAQALVKSDAGMIGQAICERQAMLKSDMEANDRRETVLPSTRAQMVLPFCSGERCIGVLNLETYRPEHFTPEVFDFLKLLAARAAVTIDNAHLYENQTALVQELEAFAHTVAHDLKNPLSALIIDAGLLVVHFDKLTAKEQHHRLEKIKKTAHRMSNIIDALLLLASVRQLDEVPIDSLDMALLVGEVQQRLEHMIADQQAEVVLPDTWPAVKSFAPWVEEVWVNYLSNALKYGGQPPHIELGAEAQSSGMVRFWIRDNGPGLTPEEQAQLFVPFSRLSQAQVKGHGLGLSIVQRIVAKLGGEVGVESEPGTGSTFSFTLPGVAD